MRIGIWWALVEVKSREFWEDFRERTGKSRWGGGPVGLKPDSVFESLPFPILYRCESGRGGANAAQ